MALIVMKFGGTSVGSAERIRHAARIVADVVAEHRVIVVVSALAGITDLILQAVRAAVNGTDVELESILAEIELRHSGALHELFAFSHRSDRRHTNTEPPLIDRRQAHRRDSDVGSPAEQAVHSVLDQFRSFCSALLLLRSATPQVMDVALPMGEKMSAHIFNAALDQLGVPSEFVDSSHLLVTDERFGDALPDMEATRSRSREVLLPLVSKGSVPVVTGYSGTTPGGQPTTLGRGGSDSSATIIGAAVEADEVWIWTDVDGVLTADPRICPDAQTLSDITFNEAVELSYYGAKVIHHKAITPVMDAGIPVWIKNSFQPQARGTRISANAGSGGYQVKAVTAVTPASLVTITTRREVHFAEIFGRLFTRLGHENVDVLFSTQSSSENALGLVLREQDTQRVLSAAERLFRVELRHGMLHPISVQRDIAVVAVMGESMKGVKGILGRLFSAVASQNLSVIAVAQGASELNICFAVEAARAADAVRAVHGEFFARSSALNAPVHSER